MKNSWLWTALLAIFLTATTMAVGQEDWLSGGQVYYNSPNGYRWVSAYDGSVANGSYESNSVYYSYSSANHNMIYLFDGYGQPKGYYDNPKGMFYYYGMDYNNDPWFKQTAVPFLRDGFHYQFADSKVSYMHQPYWKGPLMDWFGYKALMNWRANQYQHDMFYNKYALPLVKDKAPGQLVVIP